MAEMATTVLIVDDHTAFRVRARRMLEADGFEVVGQVRRKAPQASTRPDGRGAPDAGPARPGRSWQDTTGFAVAEAIDGDTAVVITSTHEDEDFGVIGGARQRRARVRRQVGFRALRSSSRPPNSLWRRRAASRR